MKYDAWHFLVSYEQQKLDVNRYEGLSPILFSVKLKTIPWVVTQYKLGSRIKNFKISFHGEHSIPIIPNGRLAHLIVDYYHRKYLHPDVDTTMTYVRANVWVIEGRRIATKIDKKCVGCKLKRSVLCSQVMGDLPAYRYDSSAPAWSTVLMDLFGPMEIRGEVNKRSRGKVWGVLYTCALTRAVHMDVAVNYGTEAILHTLRRLKARRGNIFRVVSDPGTQLKGASKELKKWVAGWDKGELLRFGAENQLKWEFIMPNSQHQNGGAEAMVKVAKGVIKSLLKALGHTVLSLNELFTLFDECSNLVNERPIGLKPNSRTDPEYLSPNSLLLGRSSERIASGPFQSKDEFCDNPLKAKSRFLLVQRITDQYWKVWQNLYFPTLLVRQKWHHQKRNLMVGDICKLRDTNSLRGEWRLCRVVKVHPDKTGVVRNVDIEVAAKYSGDVKYKFQAPSAISRHVSNLVVLLPADIDEETSS